LKIITSYQEFKEFRNTIESISFVPTMGNLHKGHMALIDKAKSYDSHVSASIFINPLQFNDLSDFKNYPKSLDDDIALLSKHGCDSVFIPDSSILKNIKEIKAPDTALYLCGMNRPGHFDGVLTIVNKLFEITKPTTSFFGKKDFQQLTLIKNFVLENNLSIEIISVDTVRELNGLAMSSRNNRLCESDREKASKLYKTLSSIKDNSNILSHEMIKSHKDELTKQGFDVDYLSVCNPISLKDLEDFNSKPILVAIAASISGIRLIDNVLID
jgi:pantoate--beta-alanine ligase